MSARTTYYVTIAVKHEYTYSMCAESAEEAERMAREDGEDVIRVEHWTQVEEDQ